MKHTTFELYRCSPLLWAGLEYEDALKFRIEKALEAKIYYRIEAKKLNNIDEKNFKYLVKCYENSDEAVEWNRKFLQEIENEREKINDTI